MEPLLAWVAQGPPDDRPDHELLAAFVADDDERAFAEVVRRHGPVVWGVSRRMLPDPADAEDAFQATFLVLVRRGRRPPAVLGPWLHRVAVLTARGVRRRNARRLARLRPLPADVPARPAAEPGGADELLLRMPERYRVAVVLRHLQGLTEREAAARIGCAVGTLSARVSRGLAWLRERVPAETLAVAAAAVPAATAAAAVRTAVVVRASGAAPAAVSELVTGVTRGMILTKLRLTALAIPVALVAAVAAGRTDPPSSRSQAPPPADRGEPAWRAAFRTAYALSDGQALKLVAGDPFPAARADAVRHSMYPDPPPATPEWLARLDGQLLTVASDGRRLTIRRIHEGGYGWLDEQTRNGIERRLHGRALDRLIEDAIGLRPPLVRADPALLATEVYADVVVRVGAPLDKIADALRTELKRTLGLKLAVTARVEEREVIVARGRYVHRPRPGRDNGMIDVAAADHPNEWPPYVEVGDGPAVLFRRLGERVDRPVIDETDPKSWTPAATNGYVGCRWPRQGRYDSRPAAGSGERVAILKHVAAQTGVTFAAERRTVSVLSLVRAD